MADGEKPSWRERDRAKDRNEAVRGPREGRPSPRVATATAQYKRQLDALFDRGEVPAHLRDKLPAPEAPSDPAARERVRLTRAVRTGASGPTLVSALDALRAATGSVPEDLELVLRFLEHPSDAVLQEALARVEHALDEGLPFPKTARKTWVTRLEGVAVTSFDPRVQSRAAALAARMK